MDTTITLGDRIREARGTLTQDELAERIRHRRPHLKVTGVYISKYERDVQSPRLSMLSAIAEATDRPLDFFRVDDDRQENGSGDDDEEEDSQLLMRAAYQLERSGEYALSDALRLRARRAAVKVRSRSREDVRA